MKKCSNCFKVLPLRMFYLKRPNGRQSRCKLCNAEVVRGYVRRKKLKELEQKIRFNRLLLMERL